MAHISTTRKLGKIMNRNLILKIVAGVIAAAALWYVAGLPL